MEGQSGYDNSQISLRALKAITISPSSNYLNFGEEMIAPGKEISPESPIVLSVRGLYEKRIYLKVDREVELRNKKGDTITFRSSLSGSEGESREEGDYILWESDSPVFAFGTPVLLDFSGRIFLTNLEAVGTYTGVVRVEVGYN